MLVIRNNINYNKNMEPEEKKGTKTEEEKFELIFKNGALANLKKLASRLNIPQDNLGEVVNRSIKILSIIKNVDTQTLTLETKNKERYVLDADKL